MPQARKRKVVNDSGGDGREPPAAAEPPEPSPAAAAEPPEPSPAAAAAAPKRLNAFMVFCMARRTLPQYEGMKVTERARLLGAEWRELTEEEKAHYKQMAQTTAQTKPHASA